MSTISNIQIQSWFLSQLVHHPFREAEHMSWQFRLTIEQCEWCYVTRDEVTGDGDAGDGDAGDRNVRDRVTGELAHWRPCPFGTKQVVSRNLAVILLLVLDHFLNPNTHTHTTHTHTHTHTHKSKIRWNKIWKRPGPASSEGEHSLCNFCLQKTVDWFSLTPRFFSCRKGFVGLFFTKPLPINAG